MATRRHLVFVLAGVFLSMGASARTTNFVVDAPTPQLAQQFAQAAEQYRKEKALQWLGQEMPTWPEPCQIRIPEFDDFAQTRIIRPGGARFPGRRFQPCRPRDLS